MDKNKDEKPRDADREPHEDEEIILLEDLAPRDDVKGGSGKILFGEAPGDDGQGGRNDAAGGTDKSERR